MRSVFSAIIAAAATALVAYLSRKHRLPRVWHWFVRSLRIAARAVYHNTAIVLYVAILAGIGINIHQSMVLSKDIHITTNAACSYLEDLRVRYESNKLQHAHARLFGLSSLAVKDLEHRIRVQRKAIQALGVLECPRVG